MPTEVKNELDRIEGAVCNIKTAITDQGITVPTTAKIDDLAPLVRSIRAKPVLQDKGVTPNYTTQTITADSGYDGLGTVTVTKIPLSFVDTSSGDAIAGEILDGKKAYVDGDLVTGAMKNNGAVTDTLGMNSQGFFKEWAVIPAGYHNGNGRIVVYGETKTVTPNDKTQQIFPTGGAQGSVLSKVTVNPIPDKYKDTTGANATPSQVLTGSKFVGANGVVETGAIPIYDDSEIQAQYVKASDSGNGYIFLAEAVQDKLFLPNGSINVDVNKNDFGNASANMVYPGYTFTSKDGVKIKGTMPIYDYTPMRAYYDSEDSENYNFISSVPGAKNTAFEDEVYTKIPKSTFGDAESRYVAEGFTFTSDEGFRVEGGLKVRDSGPYEGSYDGFDSGDIYIRTPLERSIYEDGYIDTVVQAAEFGNVDKWHVAEGYTFTSKNGVCIEGGIPVYDYSNIEASYIGDEDTDTGFAFMGSVGSGALMEDEIYLEVPKEQFGNVHPANVPKGMTFTSMNGVCIEGEAPVYDYSELDGYYSYEQADEFVFMGDMPEPSFANDEIYIKVPKSAFGNAKASDVKKGVKFTSASGVCLTGTYEAASIATCNVTITFGASVGTVGVTATTFASGAVETFDQTKSSGTFTINNVVCGSIISVICNGMFSLDTTISIGSVGATSAYLIVPSTAGNYTAQIIAYDD